MPEPGKRSHRRSIRAWTSCTKSGSRSRNSRNWRRRWSGCGSGEW